MQRRLVPELMDAPDVDPAEHRRALAGLRRINLLSRAAESMVGPIYAFARDNKLPRIRLLDVASGGGDVPIAIAKALKSRGIDMAVTFFDQSGIGLIDAVGKAKELRINAEAQTGNALEALPQQAYDVVTCSLFLHHLDRPQTIAALSQMKAACGGLIIVSDLARSRMGLFAAMIGCHLLSRSPLVHNDGPSSVRAAWTPGELHELAHHAGLEGADVRRCFPWRMLLTHRYG